MMGCMTEYRPPKLVGRLMPLNALMHPENHRLAWERAQKLDISMTKYIDALVARDNGRPSILDHLEGEQQRLFPQDDDPEKD